MSCSCGDSCSCGSGCKCGSSMYPNLGFSETATTQTIIAGVAPAKMHYEVSEMSFEAADNGCKCGSSCTCDPCNC